MAGQTVTGSVVVNQAELAKVASDLRISAETVENAVTNVTDNMFGANGEAGRNYAKQGKDVHDGLDRVANWIRIWSTAAVNTADAMGQNAVTYHAVDVENAKQTEKAAEK